MEINTITFLFLFLPLLLIGRLLTPQKYTNILIIVLGIIYYSFKNPIYTLLIIIMSCINYYLMNYVVKGNKHKKEILIGLLLFNIIIIFIPCLILKEISYIMILLSLQNISFIINSNKENKLIENKFIDYLSFSFIFPRVIGSNIINYNKELKKYYLEKNKLVYIFEGIKLIMLGYIMNILIANKMEELFIFILNTQDIAKMTYVLGIIAAYIAVIFKIISFYIISQGVTTIIGLKLEANFNKKIISNNMSEFMKNFYSSINNWVKDIIYNNIEGHIHSEKIYYGIILLIWIIIGLFFRANINGLIFGLLVGIILLFETHNTKYKKTLIYKIIFNIILVLLIASLAFKNTPFIKYLADTLNILDGVIINKQTLYFLYTNIIIIIIALLLIFNINDYCKIKPTVEYFIFKNAMFIILFIISVSIMFSNYYIFNLIY